MTTYYSETVGLERTDPSLWRLRTDSLGRELWAYLSPEEAALEPQSTYVQHLLQVPEFPAPKPLRARTPFAAAQNGADFLALLQEDSGVFPCQYKGPMFMTIGYVASHYFTKTEIPAHIKIELIRYIVNTAHPVDGGWGLHSVDKSTCFGTTMNYVILRLLGLPATHVVVRKARKTLHRLGGAIGNPHWGKAWLALLNLYSWEGVNPAPPEMWMLPYAVPIHPARWWVHTRAIYLPLGYLSLSRAQCALDDLLSAIRTEIYTQDYASIDFSRHRDTVCGVDLYYPHTTLLNTLNAGLVVYEKYLRPNWLLKRAHRRVFELIQKEVENTDGLTIAPVSHAFDLIVAYIEGGKDSPTYKMLYSRVNDTLFHGPQGMVVMGTNGVQVWDAAFAVQYLFMAGLAELPRYRGVVARAYTLLLHSQFDTECVPGSFRDARDGGWPFSTKTQGYTVSDCSAEALKAIIMVKNSPVFGDLPQIEDTRLHATVDVLLSLQNTGSFHFGSFSTYEKIKATPMLELINPAEVFGNIMVEYPYVECTDSCVLGLTYFREHYDYRAAEVDAAIANAIDYIVSLQEPDGSWYGCWGICFTYAGMFALEALETVGRTYQNDATVKKGCDFLVARQLIDGGWGESMKSCETHTYVSTRAALVVQTAWAVIGLLLAQYPDRTVIARGVKVLMERQKENGEWVFEEPEGVFNHSCAIEYASYKFLFPIKALGLWCARYGDGPIH
ncbi:hypothetical protein BABINDRAFT_33741 [Babjeviella inositovora NRRL Y-12698]|uniref:Terpene cyclase/mutase family member n=1 Tax=Babjeviella inositovora NRRL Y-12698 TaxID=984486 RepID=A0A1E3QW31_9ASCO|nr:uncharacterized protein BABINDRAFT_33741 [Babjeviella inositovora NRRL Y-12698]ODQ81187.1 hypothetical protein BABINDRAFT_33741 [Babjeviella inositovora NRRL Y-12698]